MSTNAISWLTVYFGYATAVNAFRMVMYFVNLEGVTKIKITKQAWEDTRIQELAYAYAKMIRLFMIFRTIVCAWAFTVLKEDSYKQSLCLAITAFDCYMLRGILLNATARKDRAVLGHRNIYLPAGIHGSLCVAGAACLLAHHYM